MQSADVFDPRGYREFMSQAPHGLPGPWEATDTARVVQALRRSGPRPMRELGADQDFEEWPEKRLEAAVVAAWSRNLISIDPSDLLFAL
jgi:hypothetical protein